MDDNFQQRRSFRITDCSAVIEGKLNQRTVVKKILLPAEADILDYSMLHELIGLYRTRSLPGIVATEKISLSSTYQDGLPVIRADILFPRYTSDLLEFIERVPLARRLTFLPTITQKLITGLQYIHSRGILHRDIKPANILLGYRRVDKEIVSNLIVVIADFGLCVTELNEDNLYSSMAYTRNYRPPEVAAQNTFYRTNDISNSQNARSSNLSYSSDDLSHQSNEDMIHYDQTADIWALGLTILEIIAGQPLIPDTNFQDVQYENSQLIRRCLTNLRGNHSDNSLNDMIQKLIRSELHDYVDVERYLDKLSPSLISKVSWIRVNNWPILEWLRICLSTYPPDRRVALIQKTDSGVCNLGIYTSTIYRPRIDVRCMCQAKQYLTTVRCMAEIGVYRKISTYLLIQAIDLCERYLSDCQIKQTECQLLALISLDIVYKLIDNSSLGLVDLIKELEVARLIDWVDLLQLTRFTIKLLIKMKFQLIGSVTEFCSNLNIKPKMIAKIYGYYEQRSSELSELCELNINYKYLLDPEHIQRVFA